MDINRGNMNTLFTGYSAVFQNAFGLAPNTYERFSTVVKGNQQIMEYPFLEQFAGMRQWIGDRQIKNISSKKLTVTEKPYEDTVSVKKRDIETDQYGTYNPLISQLGLNAGKLWNDLAFAALVANGTWLDSVAFFSASSRKYGDNTIKNYVTSALSASTFNTAYQEMMEYKGHNDKSLGVVPDLLIVGPKLRTTAWDIVKNELIATGSTNTTTSVKNANAGLVEMIVCPDLTGTYDDYWFLACTRGVIKPMIVQKGKDPVLTRMDRDTDENAFMRAEFLYGTEAYGAAALAFPHLIYAGYAS
jgi:phage major head subunit gpT-like protein